MKRWDIPVSWEVCGHISVVADTLEQAMEIAKTDENIPLPDNGTYVDGSWEVWDEDIELVRQCYNDNQADENPPVTMTYAELASAFRKAEDEGRHITGYIVFTEDSFTKPYSLEARTYIVSSENKAYQPNMGGYSIFGSSIDGSDINIRLEAYMRDEKGGTDGWKVERCYMYL